MNSPFVGKRSEAGLIEEPPLHRIPTDFGIRHQQNTFRIGCLHGLSQTFKELTDEAVLRRPELPVLVVSGLPGARKTTFVNNLSLYLQQEGIEFQTLPIDMFVTQNISRQLLFAGCISVADFSSKILTRDIVCSVGLGALKILHEFPNIAEIVDRLEHSNEVMTLTAFSCKHKARVLEPRKFTIIEGYSASHFSQNIAGATHCFLDDGIEDSRARFVDRHSYNSREKFRAKIRSLFLHSSAIAELVLAQKEIADFIVQIEATLDLRSASIVPVL